MKNKEKEILRSLDYYLHEAIKVCSGFTTKYGKGVKDGYQCALSHLNFLLKLHECSLEENNNEDDN